MDIIVRMVGGVGIRIAETEGRVCTEGEETL